MAGIVLNKGNLFDLGEGSLEIYQIPFIRVQNIQA